MKNSLKVPKSSWPAIEPDSAIPRITQLTCSIADKVKSGEFKSGAMMPSLNELSDFIGVSKETVYKAYRRLCKSGVLESRQGKGYFVVGKEQVGNNILVIVDKISAHQQTALNALSDSLGDKVRLTIKMHLQSLDLFRGYIESCIGEYDYYVVFPHFSPDFATQHKVLLLLKKLPQGRLIIIDKLITGLGTQYGAAFQSITNDIMNGLSPSIEDFRKYKRLVLYPLASSLYYDAVADSLRRFCRKFNLPLEIVEKGDSYTVQKGDVFFVTGSRLDTSFVQLIRSIRSIENNNLRLGRDIGVICYNDFQINELLLGGLTTLSSDFAQMGREAAQMILTGKMRRVHCRCSFIRRNTF